MTLLDIKDLDIRINGARILDGVALSIEPGESVGLVGESGCGKSMTALAVLGLAPEGANIRGSIRLDGEELTGLSEPSLCDLRGRRVAMIFQEPMTALNPAMTVGDQIAEGLRLHTSLDAGEIAVRVLDMMDRVGLPAPRFSPGLYPHQLSGGQRQRIMIAMALAMEPELLIADEPTTALDVTVQIEILRLLREIAGETGMALLLITHDLGVVAAMCERMLVMYAGRVIESGPTEAVMARLAHPYTRGLLEALPQADHAGRRLAVIPGTVPGPYDAIEGCAFAPRCGHGSGICTDRPPELVTLGPGHEVACFHPRPSAHSGPGTSGAGR